MAHPVFSSEGEVLLSVQLVSKKTAGSKHNAGFTNFDELFLSLVAAMLQAKLHQVQAV